MVNKILQLANKIWNSIKLSPTRVIVVYFVLIIIIGTILLKLPISSKGGNSTSFIDALFTSTSAACVTGLAVFDTYNYWSLFGQMVILFLIQLGGLGIVTLATIFSIMLGSRAGLKGMILARESIGLFSFSDSLKMVKRAIVFVLMAELIGAVLLAIRFIPQFGLNGIYMSIFHSISAFCNAGFDLMGILGKGDFIGLYPYRDDPFVIYTIAMLVVCGGLGFLVFNDLHNYRKTKTLLLNTHMALTISAILIVIGAILIFGFEMNNVNTIGKMTLAEKINTAVFQSVVPRTAGFSIVNLGAAKDITKILNIVLMFIGATPGSTGGGIKVTTFGVILMAVVSEIKGRQYTVIFKKRISYAVIIKALSVIALSIALIIVVASIIILLENRPFLEVLFEATSAFGTVGLSTGITPSLGVVSKVLLSFTMFLGRVGLLTFAISLALKSTKAYDSTVYPEGKVVVG